jgi:flagellar hook assembly protein FlgD
VINPVNGDKAVLTYKLETPGMVTVQVFTLDGKIVKILHRGRQGAGTYTYKWDGKNTGGNMVARGIYFIRVVAPGVDEYRKVMVVKDRN